MLNTPRDAYDLRENDRGVDFRDNVNHNPFLLEDDFSSAPELIFHGRRGLYDVIGDERRRELQQSPENPVEASKSPAEPVKWASPSLSPWKEIEAKEEAAKAKKPKTDAKRAREKRARKRRAAAKAAAKAAVDLEAESNKVQTPADNLAGGTSV